MAATIAMDDVNSELYGEDVRIIKVTGDASYPTGGYALAGTIPPNSSKLLGINEAITNIPLWDGVAFKVKFIVRATGAEVGAAVDVSASTVRLLVPA
jgi:hypothetical protein